jgi:hypothetical protein
MVSSVAAENICAAPDDPIRARLFATTLFMQGIGTFMQTLFGVR